MFVRKMVHVFIPLPFTDFLSFRPCLTCSHCLSLPGGRCKEKEARLEGSSPSQL